MPPPHLASQHALTFTGGDEEVTVRTQVREGQVDNGASVTTTGERGLAERCGHGLPRPVSRDLLIEMKFFLYYILYSVIDLQY